MVLSKNKIKFIHSLAMKKFRNEHGMFVAEGNKMVADMLGMFDCEMIAAKASWMATQGDIPVAELLEAGEEDIRKASFLKNPQDVIAVFKLPVYDLSSIETSKELVLALDGVQDPGNLGTIIRIADWFGIHDIVCSIDTVDAFAPKTVQATMGALARVRIHYTDLTEFLKIESTKGTPIYGTYLDGENLYARELNPNGIVLMGNEGNGIRSENESFISEKLFIPNYPGCEPTSESLNVAIATAIVCAEFRRRVI